MKTEVKMKRELFGCEITQMSKSEFFSATDLVKAGDKWRAENNLSPFNLYQYIRGSKTKEFIQELELKYTKALLTGRGRNAHTYVHPLLFIDIALAINPKLKIEVYEWLFDNLIRFRNESGDSYRDMCAALFTRNTNHKEFPNTITNIARQIKKEVGVSDWESASEKQLEKRDKIHQNIKLLCRVMKDIDAIVRIAIEESK